MAYHVKTGEILPGSFGVDPNDFDCHAVAGGALITAWRSGIAQPSEAAVLAVAGAYASVPNPYTEYVAAQKAATVGVHNAVRLNVGRSTSGVAFTDVTGLSFPLLPNKHYIFTFDGAYVTASVNTGLQLAINGPATPTTFVCGIEIAESATAWRTFAVSAYDTGGNATGSAGATGLPFHVFGNISTNSAGGTLQLRFRSEVNASQVTIAAGSYGEIKAVGT